MSSVYLFSLLGYDVIAQAQSGTGKTATFAISILQQIDVDLKDTQALVLAPTRELAQQVGSLSNTKELRSCTDGVLSFVFFLFLFWPPSVHEIKILCTKRLQVLDI